MHSRLTSRLRQAAFLIATLTSALCACNSTAPIGVPATSPRSTPQSEFGALFVAVQEAGVFADSKTFADAVPRSAPAQIMARYATLNAQSSGDLHEFVDANFVVPQTGDADDNAAAGARRLDINMHIDLLWAHLTRRPQVVSAYSSLLALPRRYVVPGGRFRELYYWDSYFTMLGLMASGRRDLAEDMVRNFAHLIDSYGHIPNGTRTYYLSRSQPPFFFAMVGLLDAANPARAYSRYLPQLQREYAFWMAGSDTAQPESAHRRVVLLGNHVVLNRYWDDADTPRDESYREDVALAEHSMRKAADVYRDIRAAAESGWDFSSRWLADGRTMASIHTTDIVPVDLNSLLFGLESAIEQGCAQQKNVRCAAEFSARAQSRKDAMNQYLWNETAGAYFDFDWRSRHHSTQLTAATLYPLFAKLSSNAQAQAIARVVQQSLLGRGGVLTTLSNTGQQWDAPNGWAPLQWVAVAGLRRYSLDPLAREIACRWMSSVNRVYQDSGKLVEKYDVVNPQRRGGGGEYPLQDGFGWTNGVMRELTTLYPAFAENPNDALCASA